MGEARAKKRRPPPLPKRLIKSRPVMQYFKEKTSRVEEPVSLESNQAALKGNVHGQSKLFL